MTESPPSSDSSAADSPAAGTSAVDGPAAPADVSAGEQMARRLVQDVAAYEIDPPPPARAGDQAPDQEEALAADQAADGRGGGT